MITIQLIGQNLIAMRCHYAYRDRCRSIPGARFDMMRKTWVAPLSSLPYVRAEFEGELYFKTPLWKLYGYAEPEKQPLQLFGRSPRVPDLKLTPYKYQADGIRFMIDRLLNMGFVVNGDSVGLGKTLQTIGTMKWFREFAGTKKILIICKKSIKTQWESEIRRIAGWDDEPIFVTGSTKKKRLTAYEGIKDADRGILITNYHNFLNDFDEINEINYDLCVIDEAHCIKSRGSKMNTLIGDTVCGKATILLTGTPIMSRPDDIWGIIHMVSPDYFGPYSEFKEKYIVTEFGIYGEQIIGAKNLDELQQMIQKFLIMRTAEEVALDLPKRRTPKRFLCDMDPTQAKMQDYIERMKTKQDQKKEELLNRYGASERTMAEIERMNEMSKQYIASLQFIADDPAIFRYLDPERGVNKTLQKMVPKSYTMSAKTEACIDIISEIVDADEKAIVFCHFATTAKMLKDHFDKISGANTVLYTGAESDDAREINIGLFKHDPETRVIIGTEAMAEGLNLQVARNIIHYEQADTYAQREQRIGRIRRIGSAYRYINVIDLLTEKGFDLVKLGKIYKDKQVVDSLLDVG